MSERRHAHSYPQFGSPVLHSGRISLIGPVSDPCPERHASRVIGRQPASTTSFAGDPCHAKRHPPMTSSRSVMPCESGTPFAEGQLACAVNLDPPVP
jgi:hypothetical protein